MNYNLCHYLSGSVLAAMVFQSQASAATDTFSHIATWGVHTTTAIYDPTVDAGAPFGLQLESLTQTAYSNQAMTPCTLLTNAGYANNFFVPKVNVQTTGSWTATFTFTVTQAMTLDSVNLGVISSSGTGTTQSEARSAQFSFDLKSSDGGTSLFNSNASQAITPGSTATTVQLANTLATPCTLGPGEYVISLTSAKSTETAGSFFGLHNIAFNGTLVPEPATASLSLLGLAALAWRRRK